MAATYSVVVDPEVGLDEIDLDDLGIEQRLSASHALVETELTQSELYHDIKWRLPDDTSLFVGRLAATPKMKGQRPGSVQWSRAHLAGAVQA